MTFELLQNEFIPWAPWNVPVTQSKVALVATAGVFLKKGLHQPFSLDAAGGDPTFREFPSLVAYDDLDAAHAGLDLKYARADYNTVFPLERLRELAETGYIGAVAPFAYSFMGQVSDPVSLLANYAPSVGYRLKRMGAGVALLVAGSPLDHQTAAIVARAAELAGVPTIVLGNDKAALERLGVPRGVVVQHPDGALLGNPGNAGKHQYLLRELFDAAWQFEGPGLVTELPFKWLGE